MSSMPILDAIVATEYRESILEMVKDFTDRHIRPEMMDWDKDQRFPLEVFQKLGELGLLGVLVPQEYGGAGLQYADGHQQGTIKRLIYGR